MNDWFLASYLIFACFEFYVLNINLAEKYPRLFEMISRKQDGGLGGLPFINP